MDQTQQQEDLDLHGLGLSEWSKELKSMKSTSITTVDISVNQFSKVSTDLVKNLPAVKRFDGCDNKFSKFPTIEKWAQLTVLRLDNNTLKAIPSSIKSFSNLEQLSIRGNLLKKLPAEVNMLAKLTVLDVSNNPITKLPLTDLPSLKILVANSCRLEAVPPLNGMTSLEKLSIRANMITAFPVLACSSLREVDLSNNQLTNIPPKYITMLENLVTLEVSHNELDSLPQTMDTLRSLQRFYATHNRFTAIPVPLLSCHKLTDIDLSHNKLQKLTSKLPSACKKLRSLTVVNNQITKLPKSYTHLEELQKLLVAENPIDEHDAESLETLECLASQCTKGFDFQIAPTTTTVVVDGQTLQRLAIGKKQVFKVVETGEVLPPHSVRCLKATGEMLLREQQAQQKQQASGSSSTDLAQPVVFDSIPKAQRLSRGMSATENPFGEGRRRQTADWSKYVAKPAKK